MTKSSSGDEQKRRGRVFQMESQHEGKLGKDFQVFYKLREGLYSWSSEQGDK